MALSPSADTIPTSLIAELVVESYFPQVRHYVANNGIQYELKQISMKSSPVARSVFDLRLKADAMRCRSIDDVRRRLTEDYERTVGEVEDTFVRYPIPLLQVVGTQLVPFLYEANWPEGTSVRSLRTSGEAVIRLLPGVAKRLIVLGPLLRPLVQMQRRKERPSGRSSACWSLERSHHRSRHTTAIFGDRDSLADECDEKSRTGEEHLQRARSRHAIVAARQRVRCSDWPGVRSWLMCPVENHRLPGQPLPGRAPRVQRPACRRQSLLQMEVSITSVNRMVSPPVAIGNAQPKRAPACSVATAVHASG